MKWFIYAWFIILYLSLTFFGLGPVLFADGGKLERIWTLLVVMALYLVITLFLIRWRRKKKL